MNINGVTPFAYDAYKKFDNNKIADRPEKKETPKNGQIRDDFVKNGNIDNFLNDISQLANYTKSMPDVREEKLAEVNKKIAEGYYSRDEFMNAFAGKLAEVI